MINLEPELNDYFYLIRENSVTLHKINFLSYPVFEWGQLGKTSCGWGNIKDLQPNTTGKVKWIKLEGGE